MPRVQSCGRQGVLPGGAVRVRASGHGADRRAGFAGLATCGSVWACPVCSERILAGRQEDLAAAIATWEAGGGRVALITLTMRHNASQALSQLWDGLTYAWSKVTSGRTWDRLNLSYGTPDLATDRLARRIGWARVVETTHGRSGWHVHVHAALFLPAHVTDDQVADLVGSMFATWSAALVRKKFRAPSDAHGVDVSMSDRSRLGSYFAKGVYDGDASRLALELARGDLKLARNGNRSPFRILSDVVELGLVDDVELWTEWENASKGRQQLTWASGFRALLVTAAEKTDEELASEEIGSADDDLVEIPAEGIRSLNLLGLHGLVLDYAEADDGGRLLRRHLDAWGIPYTVCNETGRGLLSLHGE